MTTIGMRVMLFFCSYFPLTFIISILAIGLWPWWVIALLFCTLGLGSLALTWVYFSWMLRRQYVEQKRVVNFARRDSEVMGYIASYLIPFVSFQLGSWQQIFALGIFLTVLLIIYVHSNMIYINPMLNVVGYRLYEIEIEHSQGTHYYIAKKRLERDHAIRFVALSKDIYLESKR
ncbi:MAG TPA: hypothetical protein VKY19_00520 [Ktedonosporobacter sp.]|nr:hypothetical protein [Ktedonosporobacter sp.]